MRLNRNSAWNSARLVLPLLAISMVLAVGTYACGGENPPDCDASDYAAAAEAACDASRTCQGDFEPTCVGGAMGGMQGADGLCAASCRTCQCVDMGSGPDNQLEDESPTWF